METAPKSLDPGPRAHATANDVSECLYDSSHGINP